MSILSIHKDPFITTATIRRPDAMNAINFELMDRLEALLDQLESDDEVRLFVLTGSENNFISGGDLKEFHQIKDADGAKRMTLRMIRLLERFENLPFWTLAALNGDVYGGGWEMMLFFDFCVAKDDIKIGFTQGKFYLPPAWGGITKLSKIVGREQALYWLASNRVISAEAALKQGLIQDVFESDLFESKLEDLTKELTRNDRTFIDYIKRRDLKSPSDEVDPFSYFWESEEHLQRVDRFLKRKK